MKKSNSVQITLLAATALISTGCSRNQLQRCVDPNGIVVDDRRCDEGHAPYGGGGSGGAYPYYRWYYGGRGYSPGEVAGEGSFEPAANVPVVRASSPEGISIIRGGFGHGFGEAGE